MSVSRLQNLTGDLTPIADHFNRTIVCTQAYYVQHYQDPKETSPFPDGCFIVVKDDTQSVMNGFVDQMYPVGSVYMNALVQTDPNVLFNFGTWTRITGRFLYAASTSDTLLDTGGANTVTLTQANLPTSVTFTIPSLDLSIDETSTKHTHTTPAYSGYTGNVTGTEDGEEWNHSHSPRSPTASSTVTTGYTADDSTAGGNFVFSIGNGSSKYTPTGRFGRLISSADLQHDHPFTVPVLTTSEMSDNEKHSHTGKTTAASKTILDFGSGTAFSIIPPYVKLAIWYRAS